VGCPMVAFRAGAAPPTILSEPQNVTVNNASAAAFTVVASNAVSYQWQFQGTNNLAGATNATLSLDDVSTNQAGGYTVVVTSSDNASVTSAPPAVLTIVPGTIVQWTISTYPNGSRSNFLAQLFDHDKPATVENFIHYITSGSYSNMFFDRDVTNFVLQGGDYVSEDRSDINLAANHISPGTNFPSQVDSEFNVGPLIHNRFGTLAMALASGETNSASSAFFFNLADNSASLDPQDFTVFGRILYGTNSGSNILQYFNALSAPTNGIYDGFSSVPTLPVNYDGTGQPADANFFYCDFAFRSPLPVDTTPPTVSITYPPPNAVFTNAGDLTVQGKAQDNIGLAEVFCVLTSLAGVNEGESQTNAAIGTTNWSLNFGTNEPGVYRLTAYAQDGAGNLSAPATEYFTNLAVLTIITNAAGLLSTNLEYLVPGEQYSVTAEPGDGERFINWQIQGEVSLGPEQTFTAETNFTIAVTFISTNLPSGLTITSPAAGSVVQTVNAGLTVTGNLPSSITVTNLTVQLFSRFNAVTAALPAGLNGTNWSLAVNSLVGGPYTMVVVAEDSLGQEGLVTENFTALVAPPTIIFQPANLTVNAGSAADIRVTASNAVSYQWQLVGSVPIVGATNATLALDNVSTNQSGFSYTVVVTAPDGETVTSRPAVLTVVQGTIVTLTFSRYADRDSSNVMIELFNHDKPATVENFIHLVRSDIYSNMFWSRCVPGFVLQGGDYTATNRTNTAPGLDVTSIGQELDGDADFPDQLDSEFSVGPLIHNTFGTLAMALVFGETNSARNAFFFNLVDNSASLDSQDFTVFGRIMSGADSNVLQFFNTLTTNGGGIIDYSLFDTNSTLTDLPVNYNGANQPADSNLYFCDFKFQTNTLPPLDTNPPTVTITYPLPNAVLTNGSPLTITGTASDKVGLARVFFNMASLNGAYDDSLLYSDSIGTTNWSFSVNDFLDQNVPIEFGIVQPGIYDIVATSQDGAGNLSQSVTNQFTITAVTTTGNGTAQYVESGTGSAPVNAFGANFQDDVEYMLEAIPGAGQTFVNWNNGTIASLSSNQTFQMYDGLLWTATFISNTVPSIIILTDPVANSQLTNRSFSISGTTSGNPPVQVTCQVFSTNTLKSATAATTVDGTNSFSVAVNDLAPGNYTVQAVARDTLGSASVVSQNFTVMAAVTIITNVAGHLTTNAPLYAVPGVALALTNVPGLGQQFYSWTSDGRTSINPVETVTPQGNLTLTVTFISNNLPAGLTITSPVSGSRTPVINSSLTVSGTIPSTNVTQLTSEFFVNSNSIAPAQPAIINGTNWSLTVTDLANGAYTVVALATNTMGESSFTSASFTLLNEEMLNLNIIGGGIIVSNPGQYVVPGTYTVKAVPKTGQVFYGWSDGVTTTLNPSKKFTIVSNLTLTATFVPEDASLNGITFTYPPANAKLTNVTFSMVGRIPASLTITQMTCQMFLQSNGITTSPQSVTVDPATKKWTFPVTNLTPGPYTVLALAHDSEGNSRLVSENFDILAKLAVNVQGKGTVTAGLNGKYVEVGKTYKISATPQSGQVFAFWTGAVADAYSAATTFVVSSNTELTAYFTNNLFPPVAGTYTGLFLNPGNVSPTNSGFVTLTTTGSGLSTGRLMFPSRTYPMIASFLYNGGAELRGKVSDSNDLDVILNLDLTNGTDAITGIVADQTSSRLVVWSSSLVLYRAVTRLSSTNAPAAGKYAVLLQPQNTNNVLAANGYAAISLGDGGDVALGGTLPDNTAISQSAQMSKDGIWPVYIVPSSYQAKGMIIGWQTNTPSGACDGQLFWFKPAIGYATNLTSAGAEFAPPVADTQYQVILPGGTTHLLAVSQRRQFVAEPPIVEISLLPSGVLSGLIEVNNEKLPFKGAFISPSAGGAGFILDTNGQTDGFQIPPQP
jgi:cyclophilin family peptidyl-prolyl cis-trans isomerase